MEMPREKLLALLKKLLIMRERGTEGEAANAAEKIQALTLRYGIQMHELQQAQDQQPDAGIEQHFIPVDGNKQPWKGWIMNAITDNNFCKFYWDSHYNLQQGKKQQRMVITGKDHNILITIHLYEYLVETVERLADQACAVEKQKYRAYIQSFDPNWGTPLPQPSWIAWRNDFKRGAAMRLRQRLAEQRKNVESQGISTPDAEQGMQQNVSALACREMYKRNDQAIALYLRQQGVRLTTTRTTRNSGSGGYASGNRA
ncbi:MAG TPA: hypothetical protein V6C57_26395, partial [Coleofasciculaceae cyanobacterium]